VQEKQREQLIDLAAGELKPWVAWRLRRQIAADPELAREWEETRQLWSDLKTLQSAAAPSRPVWPSVSPPSSTSPTLSFGGITMKRRTVIAACSALLFGITGAVAARQWIFEPFQDMATADGQVWRGTSTFRGEVKYYDNAGKYLGSIGSDDEGSKIVSAKITVSGTEFDLQGAGRHPLYHPSGKLLGYADLVPESAEEREKLWKEHDQRLGIDARLPMSHGCNDGYGTAYGFFGNKKEITWRLTGVATARFTNEHGQTVMRGIAGPVSEEQRASLRKTLNPEAYRLSVAETLPKYPLFTWTQNGEIHKIFGIGATDSITLPNGTRLRIDITAP
jgi:hypothetical protein